MTHSVSKPSSTSNRPTPRKIGDTVSGVKPQIDKTLTTANETVKDVGDRVGKLADEAKDAVVEIWQCDANAVYIHTSDSGSKARQQDKNFQGFGKFTTSAKGEYRFRTIKPVPYPGRPAPHIHFKVKKGSRTLLTSQFFVRGHPGNDRDGIARGGNPIDRELLMVDFKPIRESKTGELSAVFEIVLGRTPDEKDMEPK